MPNKASERKKQFKAALALAGLKQKDWLEQQGVSDTHLNAVFKGERDSNRLDQAIDALIQKYIPQKRKSAA